MRTSPESSHQWKHRLALLVLRLGLRRENFFANKMQAKDAWCRLIVEMASHRIAQMGAQLFQRLRLSEDRFAERPCGVAAFRRFLDKEDDFAHALDR